MRQTSQTRTLPRHTKFDLFFLKMVLILTICLLMYVYLLGRPRLRLERIVLLKVAYYAASTAPNFVELCPKLCQSSQIMLVDYIIMLTKKNVFRRRHWLMCGIFSYFHTFY